MNWLYATPGWGEPLKWEFFREGGWGVRDFCGLFGPAPLSPHLHCAPGEGNVRQRAEWELAAGLEGAGVSDERGVGS